MTTSTNLYTTLQVNGLTYAANAAKVSQVNNTAIFNNLINLLGSSDDPQPTISNSTENDFATFLASQNYNKNTTPLPSSFSNLMNAYVDYLANVDGSGISAINSTYTTPSAALSALENTALSDYAAALNSTISGNSVEGDLAVGTPNPVVLSNPPKATDLTSQFNAWYAAYVSTFQYGTSGSVGGAGSLTTGDTNDATAIFAPAAQQLNATAVVQETPAKQTILGSGLPGTTTTPALPSYQALFYSFFPTLSSTTQNTQFQKIYAAFVQNQVSQYGYFNPSQSYANWAHQLTVDYQQTLGPGNVTNPATSLDTLDASKVLVLNRIFSLVTQVLTTMQNVAAAQANQLLVLTQWQNAYTQSLASMPTFLATGSPTTRLSDSTNSTGSNPDSADVKASERQELNSTVLSNFRTYIQNQQSVVSNNAKTLQSNLNQTNDAVSQQANVATAIIQELSTILSAIFK
jgi:hypothetical protein